MASLNTPGYNKAEEDLLSQYMDDETTVGKCLFTLICAGKCIFCYQPQLFSFEFSPAVDAAPPAGGSNSPGLQPESGHNQSRGPEPNSTLPEGSEAGLFSGKRFLLVGFGAEADAQLSLQVMENGGRMLTGQTRIVADYAVVPLLGCSVEATVDEVVTDTWLVRT